MTPILYEKDEIDFTSQGLGSLVEIYDADVAEQRNGLLQFTASYPVTGVRYDDISVGRIILTKPNQRDEPHAFRITSTDLDIMGHNVMIEADSITYDLNHNIVKHVSVNGQSGQAMMTALQMAVVNPSIFTFYSDITHVSSTSLDYVNPMEAVIGVKGSFLQIWGGELKRENRRVAMFNRRGRDNVATFRLGKNISGLKYKVDISSLVTRILPIKSVQENDTTTYLEGTPVSSQYINSYEQIYTIKVDFTDDTIKTVDDLNKASANWFVDSANTARDKPSVTIDIDVLSLQDSADYQDKFKDLESVALTDTVTVYVPEYGINVTAIVNELHFDPIQERVTKLTVGTAKQSFADSSRTQLSDLQDKIISVQNQADATAVSANGKSTNYYGSVEPSHPQGGDTWFWVDGDKSGIKVFVDGDWVEPVDSDTQEKIATAVDDAVTQAKAYSNQLVATNREKVNAVLDDVQAKQADLTAQQAELDTKAQGYANKALADAKADTLATATQTAKDAQEYTDTAKAEAISVATTADGAINKKIDDTASSITSTISQNKADADGKITTAQSTATQALDGLTQKVSQNIYDAKVNELIGNISTAQQTADGVVTTIGNYKTSNDERVASAESKITANAEAITQKVSQSDYNTKTGQLDAQISTINQTATGISQSVANVQAQVNNLQVGGRNLLLNSKDFAKTPDWTSGTEWYIGGSLSTDTYQGLSVIQTNGAWGGPKYVISDLFSRGVVNTNDTYVLSAWIRNTSTTTTDVYFFGGAQVKDTHATLPAGSDWVRVVSSPFTVTNDGGTIRFEPGLSVTGGYIQQAGLKLEKGNMTTDLTPAPEDTATQISTVSQKVDSITSIVSDPTTGLSTRVQTAEGTLSQVTGADIPNLQKATYWQPFISLDLNTYTKQGSFFFNSTAVKPNGPNTMTNWMYLVVEQGTSDSGRVVQTAWYDTPTDAKITYRRIFAGTWGAWYANDNDSVATIAQTNGAIKTEISDRQKGDTNTLTQAKDFTTSSISNSESGMKSLITQTSDAILGKVGAINLFPNSEFEKDYGYSRLNGNTTLSLGVKNDVDGHLNGTVEVTSTASDWQGYWARNIPVYGGQSYSMSTLVHYTNGGLSNGNALLDVWFIDKDGNRISTGTIGPGGSNNSVTGQVSSPWWVKLYIENVIAPTTAVNMQVSLLVNDAGAGQTAIFTQPMVTATEKLQPYTPNNDITTQLALLKDNWSIGIADNAGAITNGIVGNSTNMSLISNNVVINAPSTQIKGTAWINSAMIGTGQIGNAQIGDLAVTSAKISNLDVNKITGNVSSFIQSNWNGVFASTTIDNTGMSINGGNTTTKFDTSGAHFTRGNLIADYSYGTWRDDSNANTSSVGMYLGVRGNTNSFTNIIGPNGGSVMLIAGENMDYGSNNNIVKGYMNIFSGVNIRSRLDFKGSRWNSPTYIEADENRRTLNFYTALGSTGTDGNYFWFSQNVLSNGVFSSASLLSKKNVKSAYDEDALGEIAKTHLVNFEYKNRIGQNHVSPIIDDVNSEKEYYIPKTILGQDNEYVDMYSMISMAWKAIQQLNEKIGDK